MSGHLIAADEIANLRAANTPADITSVSVPDELLWRIDRHLIMLRHVLVSGEVRAEVERDRAAVFRLLTEVAPV